MRDKVKDVFFLAAAHPTRDRRAILDEHCGTDSLLRHRVERLLDANDRAGDFLAEPTTGIIDVPDGIPAHPRRDEPMPSRIGPYTPERPLGEGGYGTVYLARQDEPVKRFVALKVIKPGMDSRQVIRRFKAERQALALMSHPNIARVLDAGATLEGRPYFVMELVDGEPITTYCNARRLTIRGRLRLFEQVCVAVQHAHQKGIIHRDLKPSNVLVTEIDGVPTPKVIDFGIAKALTADEIDHTTLTGARQLVGTPQYMSPEQATMGGDVDTRSDVYSLGVLLYEMLAGVPPFEPGRLRSASFHELERIIRDEDPPRPSARVGALADAADQVAADRITDPNRLVRELRGELDWIVMRALEKDRARRYPTANSIGADIARFLRNDPVDAGPPSRAYRIAKFTRRHRVAIFVATIVLLLIGAFAFGSVQFGIRADRARQRAESQLARADALGAFAQAMISGVDPAVARTADTTILRKLLAEATGRVDSELADFPDAAVDMLNTIGYTQLSIADYESAERVYRRAYNLGLARLGEDATQTLDAQNNLAAACLARDRFSEAEPLLKSLIAIRTRLLGPTHLDTLESRSNLAYLYNQTGRYQQARVEWEDILAQRRRILGSDDPATISVINNLATVISRLGDDATAVTMLEEVYAWDLQHLTREHPRTLATMNNLADSYHDLGRHEEAEALLRESLEIKRTLFEPQHPSILIGTNNLARLLIDLDRFDEAADLLYPALDLAESTLDDPSMITINLLNSLGTVERKRGNADAAEKHLLRSLEMISRITDETHPSTAFVQANLSRLYIDSGRCAEALDLADEALRLAREQNGPFAIQSMTVEINRALASKCNGDYKEAERRLLLCYEACTRSLADDNPTTREVARHLADLYTTWQRPADAAHWRAKQ